MSSSGSIAARESQAQCAIKHKKCQEISTYEIKGLRKRGEKACLHCKKNPTSRGSSMESVGIVLWLL